MPEYLSPGVYVEEVPKGTRPIEGVSTAMAAFVGFAPAGPANTPVLVTNWAQYVDKFGAGENGGRGNPHMDGGYLSRAGYGYCNNGGGRCYVVRVEPGDGNGDGQRSAKPAVQQPIPTTQIPSRSPKALPSLSASPKGTPAADIQIEVAPPVGDDAAEGTFTVKVRG